MTRKGRGRRALNCAAREPAPADIEGVVVWLLDGTNNPGFPVARLFSINTVGVATGDRTKQIVFKGPQVDPLTGHLLAAIAAVH